MAKNLKDKRYTGDEVMKTVAMVFVLKDYSIPLFTAFITQFNKDHKVAPQILKELNLEKVTTTVTITHYTGKATSSSKTYYRISGEK